MTHEAYYPHITEVKLNIKFKSKHKPTPERLARAVARVIMRRYDSVYKEVPEISETGKTTSEQYQDVFNRY